MRFFSKLLRRSGRTEKLSVPDYFGARPPGPEPLHDLLQMLALWMQSAPPVRKRSKLMDFMDSYARSWEGRVQMGTADQVAEWFKQCANRDLREEPVGNPYHVMGLVNQPERYGQIYVDNTPLDWWEDYGVVGSVIQVGVHRGYHVIGKASDVQFFYLAHGGTQSG